MSNKEKSSSKKITVQPTLTPKSRFSAFRNAEAWMLQRLAPYLNECSGRVPSDTLLPVYSSTREGLKRQDAYFDGRVLQNNSDYGLVPPGCFVYRHMSDDGLFKFNINDTGGDIAVSKEYPVFKTNNLNARFLLEKLNEGPDFKQFAFSQKAGGTRTRLYFSRLREWQTFLPQLPEQQKIADCLDSMDALIAAQGRKVEALRAHKKGLMQQLFPQEGETQPRLRFPEFQDAGDWEVKTVGDVSNVLMCKRIFAEETNPHSGVPFFKIGTLGGVPDAFIAREKFEEYKSRYNFPRHDEVLITCSGTVGKCLQYDGKEAYFQDSNIVWLDNPKGEVSNEFLFILLSGVNWGRLNSTTITRLYGPDLRGLKIKFPGVGAEQQRIADCLASLDDFIAAETRKLETLKSHKKGLMQQLFPQVGGGLTHERHPHLSEPRQAGNTVAG